MPALEAAPAAARPVSAASWRLLLAAVVAQVGFSIVGQGVPTLTGFVKGDLRTTAAMAGLAVSSFPCGKVFGSYAAGIAADRVSERHVIMAGGVAVAALVAAAMASPLPLLFVLLFTRARRQPGTARALRVLRAAGIHPWRPLDGDLGRRPDRRPRRSSSPSPSSGSSSRSSSS